MYSTKSTSPLSRRRLTSGLDRQRQNVARPLEGRPHAGTGLHLLPGVRNPMPSAGDQDHRGRRALRSDQPTHVFLSFSAFSSRILQSGVLLPLRLVTGSHRLSGFRQSRVRVPSLQLRVRRSWTSRLSLASPGQLDHVASQGFALGPSNSILKAPSAQRRGSWSLATNCLVRRVGARQPSQSTWNN